MVWRIEKSSLPLSNNQTPIEKLYLMKNLIELESVGCVFNTENNMVYPILKDGTYDMENGILITECCDEWEESLSIEDKSKLKTKYKIIDVDPDDEVQDWDTFGKDKI